MFVQRDGNGSGNAVRAGSEAKSQPKSNLLNISDKILHLVATLLVIFLLISLLNFVQLKLQETLKQNLYNGLQQSNL